MECVLFSWKGFRDTYLVNSTDLQLQPASAVAAPAALQELSGHSVHEAGVKLSPNGPW